MKNGIHLEIDFLKHFSKKNYLEGKLIFKKVRLFHKVLSCSIMIVLIETIRGGFALVWLGEDKTTKDTYAIK